MRPSPADDPVAPPRRAWLPAWAWACAATAALALPAVAAAATEPAADAEAELAGLLATPVYAASKYQQSAADAPAAVTVLTQGDIRAFGWRTLGEVLDGVRGVFLRYDRAYTYAGVRGLSRPGDYTSRLLLLIDGVRANDNIYDSVMVGHEFPLDVALIERVEFIPGPSSALYGPNAVFGVVNVVTRSAASLRGGSAALTLDNDGGRKLQLSLAREADGAALVLAGSAENRRGRDLPMPVFDRVAHGLDGERDRKVYARWTQGDWQFSALGSERRKHNPTAPFGITFDDPATEWVDQLTLLGLGWQRRDGQDTGWALQASLGEYRYHDLARYDADGLLSRYRNLGRWWNLDLRRTLHPLDGHRLVLGLDLHRNALQRTQSFTMEPVPVLTAADTTTSQRQGLYLSDDVALADALRLSLALRADHETDGHWHASQRTALVWKPRPTLVAKAMLGTAYREPNVYERNPLFGGTESAELSRERVRSRELALDWQPAAHWRLSGSVYDNRLSDRIEQATDADTGALVYRNSGTASARGAEAEAEWTGEAGWRLRASLTRQWLRLGSGGDSLPPSNAPVWLGKLHATTPLPGLPARLGLEVQHVGERLTLAGAPLPPHTVAHLHLQWEPPGAPWSLALGVYNLADTRYDDPAGPEHAMDRIAQDGRRVALRLATSF